MIRSDDGREIAVTFRHVDGMYSYCDDVHGNVVHLKAWTNLKPYEKGDKTAWEIDNSPDAEGVQN